MTVRAQTWQARSLITAVGAAAEHTFALLLTLTPIRPNLVPGTDLVGQPSPSHLLY